jgi:hypothetical protein
MLYLLKCAKAGRFPDYNLGVILARTLSYAVSHNSSTPLFVGAIATLYNIKDERKLSNPGTKINESNLIDLNVLKNMGIMRLWRDGIYMYQYMVKRGHFECTILPHLDYFDRLSDKWIAPEETHSSWDDTPSPSHYPSWEAPSS